MNTFRTAVVVLAFAAAVVASPSPAASAKQAPPSAQQAHHAPMVNASDLKWGAAPPAFTAGAQMAVVDGDPAKSGPFVIRAKFPAGYKVMPHFHPTDEHVTVISGTLAAGMGEKWDDAAMKTFTAGAADLCEPDRRSAQEVDAVTDLNPSECARRQWPWRET